VEGSEPGGNAFTCSLYQLSSAVKALAGRGRRDHPPHSGMGRRNGQKGKLKD